MKTVSLLRKVLFSAGLLLALSVARAADSGTPEEAVALVKKAVAYAKANGVGKLIEEVNKGAYVDRDLYVAVIGMDGTSLANGVNPRLTGKNLLEIMDADGKKFIREGIENAKRHNSGWSDFKWPNPVTKKIERKSTYGEKFGDVLITCGVYKPANASE